MQWNIIHCIKTNELIDDIFVVVVPLLMQLQKFNLWSYSCRDM